MIDSDQLAVVRSHTFGTINTFLGTLWVQRPPLPVQVDHGHSDKIARITLRGGLDQILSDPVDPPKGNENQSPDADSKQPAALALQVAFAQHSLQTAIPAHRPPH